MAKIWNVLVTGGAGYVGSALVPALLDAGHKVTVLDLYLYGEEVLSGVRGHPGLREVRGDLRDADTVVRALQGCNAVIHLACISNDPSFELNPELGASINHRAFLPLVRAAKAAGVERFIYASSSSVYGVKSEPEVTEDLPLEPLTDYSRFKALCEAELAAEREPGFVTCTLRPSTVCGYAPRQRLDVIVNILTNQATHRGKLTVLGGDQKRPNIHIQDMVACYLDLLQQPAGLIDGEIFNVGYENHTVRELAEIVRLTVGPHVGIDVQPTNDPRSYHVSSAKIAAKTGFVCRRTIAEAVQDLHAALTDGRLPESLTDSRYFNIRKMQEVSLT